MLRRKTTGAYDPQGESGKAAFFDGRRKKAVAFSHYGSKAERPTSRPLVEKQMANKNRYYSFCAQGGTEEKVLLLLL